MILINKGQANYFTLTLRELSDINYPMEWVIRFTLDQSEHYTYEFESNDLGTNPNYQEFQLVEGTDITFDFLGDYKYEAFQKNINKLVETGMMRVLSPTYNDTFNADNSAKIYKDDN